jgi:F-type H+-transporting ATPase subunit delta
MAQLVAAQYAQGLFELALESGKFDSVLKNLERLKGLNEHGDFVMALKHPQVEPDEKFAILKSCVYDDAPDEILGFLRVLADKGRAGILHVIIEEYVKLVDLRNNVLEAKVVSAEKLGEAHIARIKRMIEGKFEKAVRIKEHIDPSIIAGFRVYVGDDLIDTSIKKDIDDIRNSLLEFDLR